MRRVLELLTSLKVALATLEMGRPGRLQPAGVFHYAIRLERARMGRNGYADLPSFYHEEVIVELVGIDSDNEAYCQR